MKEPLWTNHTSEFTTSANGFSIQIKIHPLPCMALVPDNCKVFYKHFEQACLTSTQGAQAEIDRISF